MCRNLCVTGHLIEETIHIILALQISGGMLSLLLNAHEES